ncbi:MAG: queuosine precursor transporter [Anaerolineae bacterium]|nr:queuosine precursor transporter [Anaerolineae bacterium]
MKSYKYLDFIIGLFVAVLLISNIASSAKIVELGPFVYDGGTLLFPLSYIFGDVLTEVYGYSTSRRVIWIGFATVLLMSVTLAVVGALPGNADWLGANNFGQEAFNKILGSTPRIVAGSLVAFWAGSFANDFLLAKLKVLTNGKWLWSRTISSTLVGQGVDTLVFCLVAFLGSMPNDVLFNIIWSNYVFKVGIEVLFTPATYWVVTKLKQAEGVDTYDRETDFNPFKMKSA